MEIEAGRVNKHSIAEQHRSLRPARNELPSGGNSEVLAVVPAVAQPGDAVCLLKDYPVPVILRPYHKDIKHGEDDILRTTIRGQDLTSPGPSIGLISLSANVSLRRTCLDWGKRNASLANTVIPKCLKFTRR